MLMSLFKFKGGVKPPTHKIESVNTPISKAPLPSRLVVPLHQSIGGKPNPLVNAGDKVLKGQPIGEADGWISAAVHAPTSGTVLEVAMHPRPHPSGLSSLCVVIEPDGEDKWIALEIPDYESMTPEAVRIYLQNAGIVGLGGAGFPAHGKLLPTKGVALEELIINGAECEPFITCDDMLMRERADEIVQGIAIFRDQLQPKTTLIGIENNKPEAIAAMRAAVDAAGEDFEVVEVPTLYPAGGAKQLIRVLTGKEVPGAMRATTDMGVQVFNIATAYSAWRAIGHGEPLISRVVTLAGSVHSPHNVEALIGTPIDKLLKLAWPLPEKNGTIMGGPMMGFLVPDEQAPIIKTTNCLIAYSENLFPPKAPEMPCIRCGACARACPHELQPFQMYWYARAKNFGKTQEYNIFDCIECGCCAFVCPSRIPLVQYFRFAKSEIWAREREKQAADQAKARFEFKQFREEREKAEKAQKLAKAAAAQAAKKVTETEKTTSDPLSVPVKAAPMNASQTEASAVESTTDDAKPLLNPQSTATHNADPEKSAKMATIEAAMARAKAQREAARPKNIDNLTPEQQRDIAEVDAIRQAAGLVVPDADEQKAK